MVDACLFMEETSRGMAPIGGYGTTLIVAGATPALRHRRNRRQTSSVASPAAQWRRSR